MDGVEPVPMEKMWANISQKKEKPPHLKVVKIQMWKRISIAASILALVGWGMWFFESTPPPISIADISPELAERELQLTQLISQKEKEINWANIDKETHAEILNDLELINQNAEQTKLDINQFPDEKIIETLIRNYELKIRILENLNREIEKNKYYEELEKSI